MRCNPTGKGSVNFWSVLILLTTKQRWVIKIRHGHPILYASNVLSIFDSGRKRIGSHFALVFQWSGVNRKTISMTAASVQSTRRVSTGRTGIRWFIQTSSPQLGQLHTAMKFLFQCLKAYPNLNCLVLKKTKPPFYPQTVVKTLFQMLVFLLHYHSFFLKENLMIWLEISTFPKNLLNF